MLSIANKVFRDFKEFYSEINAATLTGAIDVIVVEQPDGSFLCSPFHVRFGKLGVLRSREKIVDIEINGQAVGIQMKLGESGEAFFVEECTEGDLSDVPNLATSPIPTSELTNYESNISEEIKIPLPRRNSIDLSKDISQDERVEKFENQISEYSQRRHTDNDLERKDFSASKMEFTTQKLRQEFAEQQDQLYDEIKEKFNLRFLDESQQFCPINEDTRDSVGETFAIDIENVCESNEKHLVEKLDDKDLVKDEGKPSQSKKKRRKKSMIKKKNSQRKSSTSSSASFTSDVIEQEDTTSNSNDISPNTENDIAKEVTLPHDDDIVIRNENNNDFSLKNEQLPSDIHFFSDGEIGTSKSPLQSRPSSPVQSDTEFEVSQREKNGNMSSQIEWKWGQPVVEEKELVDSNKRNSMLSGMLNFMKQKRKNNIDGLMLSQLDLEDPEIAALYFPPNSSDKDKNTNEEKKKLGDEDRESGNGTSLPQSPSNSLEVLKSDSENEQFSKSKTDFSLNFVALSLCGGLTGDSKIEPTEEDFNANIVQYADICQNPSIFSSPNLVVRINDKFYSWAVACPYIMTLVAYQKPLPDQACEKILHDTKMKKPLAIIEDDHQHQNIQMVESQRRSWFSWRRSGGPTNSQEQINNKSKLNELPPSEDVLNSIKENDYTISESMDEKINQTYASGEMYRKTLRLNSKQIEILNLKSGVNNVEFSVTTAYQGTSRCKCYLFKWKHNDRVIISDIDGTITRSDVLGHILPMVGKDWAQIGVAQLFSKIEENGYKILYLSARAIGQSRVTREYLKSIRQGDTKLPDGPLLLNPTSLISAFHREVIERKPEQFKIECLSDIKRLFGDKNPFYAGYGNRINDVWAYRAVGIPIMRIYTINPRGELKHELTQTFQSTYAKQLTIVDQLFPPIPKNTVDEVDDIEYTAFNFWRDPFADIDDSSSSSDVSLQAIQSKPLPTIPEN